MPADTAAEFHGARAYACSINSGEPRMARILRFLAPALWMGITPACAFEVDVHYAATFAIASAVGFARDDAELIASADQAVDENVDTWPTEHLAFGRAFGDGQQRQLEWLKLSLG